MHKISVPLMASTINNNNREKYLELCKKAKAERVFLALDSALKPIPDTLFENVKYFKAHGFEVGVWTDTIGHGFVLSHVENDETIPQFPMMVDIAGKNRPNANCPLQESFKLYITNRIAQLAKTGADIVMLDDDFRMSQHRGEICCACPEHMKRIRAILGEEISLEELRSYVLKGKANKYRDAWLQAQNEGLVELAQAIRDKVDEQTPNTKVCTCIACSPWNIDGVDVAKITRILAGKNSPLLRLTGAPYWATRKRTYSLITVFEFARMLASFVNGENIELMSEGDVYPRPRYTCPASYLELYDAVTRIDGSYDGILKYMFDYVAGPELETGYLKAHEESQPFFEKLEEFFPNGANVGVKIVVRPHTVKHADLDFASLDEYLPRPMNGTIVGSSGIPTVYKGKGLCNSVFGENARLFDLSELENGTILDAVSAVILTQRGVDVGLVDYDKLERDDISFLCTNDEEYKSFITDANVRILSATLNEKAEPMLFSAKPNGKVPMGYRYENANGERFLVFLFEGDSIYDAQKGCVSGLVKNYPIQRVLVEQIPWISRRKLPAYCVENPELYLMCEKQGNSMSIALFNCFADSLTNPVVELGDEYGEVECIGCQAVLEGNKLILTEKLHAYSSAAFRVCK